MDLLIPVSSIKCLHLLSPSNLHCNVAIPSADWGNGLIPASNRIQSSILRIPSHRQYSS